MGKSKFYTHVLPALDKIERWAVKGATAKEIAKKLGVSYSAFKGYLARGEKGEADYVDFLASFARACEVPDDDVETALHDLAVGYKVDLQKAFKVRRVEYDEVTGKKLCEYEEIIHATDQQYVEPNVQAQMFWLTNRRRDRWARNPEPADGGEEDESGIVLLAAQETPELPASVSVGEETPT